MTAQVAANVTENLNTSTTTTTSTNEKTINNAMLPIMWHNLKPLRPSD